MSYQTERNSYFDSQKVKKLIRDIEVQRNYEGYEYDETEIQILKRINQEVSELVETNRHLQAKLALLEAQSDLNSKSVDVVNFFAQLQEKMENLISFLLERSIIESAD